MTDNRISSEDLALIRESQQSYQNLSRQFQELQVMLIKAEGIYESDLFRVGQKYGINFEAGEALNLETGEIQRPASE